MSRPTKYSTKQILDAAAEVFLEDGAAASTGKIAERAGVSEATLFKRFKTKEALFEAALLGDGELDGWRQGLMDSVGQGTPRGNVECAIASLLEKLETVIPKLMVFHGRGQGHPSSEMKGAKTPPLQDAAAITAYLKKEIKLGRVNLRRPELHGHEIVGAIVHFVMSSQRQGAKICSAGEFARHLADVHLGREE